MENYIIHVIHNDNSDSEIKIKLISCEKMLKQVQKIYPTVKDIISFSRETNGIIK